MRKILFMKIGVDIYKIADLVLCYCFENAISISPLKLQKLLYYIQAWHMVYFDRAMLFNDKPQAWVNGPVYPSIYTRFKAIPIYQELNPQNTGITNTFEEIENELQLDCEQLQFLNSIFMYYGVMSHDRLVFLTHSEKPWNEQREGLNPFEHSDKELSTDTMYNYYRDRMERNRAKQ